MKFMIVLLAFVSWSLCRYFLLANISTVVVGLGGKYSLSFNIVCIFSLYLFISSVSDVHRAGQHRKEETWMDWV